MAIVCKAFVGFETGGNEEGTDGLQVPVVSATAPASSKETYSALYAWKSDTQTRPYTFDLDWVTVTTYIKFTNVGPDSEAMVCNFQDDSGYCWQLKMAADPASGQLGLYDANDDLIDSFVGVTVDVWHRIQVKFEHSNTGGIRVWLDETLKIDEASEDLSSGGTTGFAELYNPVDFHFEAAFDFRASHLSILEDDGATISSESTAPRDYCVKTFQNTTHTGVAPDVGDNLDAANAWSDAGNTPGNDATDAQYSLPLNTTKSGYVYCDGGARAGPSGDADLQDGGTIMGMTGTWRVANGVAAFNGRANFTGHVGKDDGPSVGDFGFGLIPTGVAKVNYHGVLDAAHASCVTADDYAAIGVKGVKGGLGVAARLDTFDMWASVLYREAAVADDVGVVHAGMIDA
jgi:hypothetical protein